jgi:UDP-N-acetylmuramoyl-tripeptide--D-alanyl-D-alanine ligase
MIASRLIDVAPPLAARLVGADADFRGVGTDSRTLAPGMLFVALRGEHHDGHEHVAAAAERGAAGVVVERELATTLPQLVVLDSQVALGELARWQRAHLAATVVALTGSNGKTTVKTLAAAILARVGSTYCTEGNLNNEIGLPLTVLRAPADARFLVLEMGAGKPGDIAYLVRIGQPHVALVNNVAPAHLERLGSTDGVAEAKGAIYDGLPPGGIAVVNADDAYAERFVRRIGARRVLRFGLDQPAEIGARALQLGEGARFTLVTPAGEAEVALPLAGRHNVRNALAAAALAFAAGAPLADIAAGLGGAHGVGGRLTRLEVPGAGVVIDDSYNANPGSVRAAIDTLALARGERWLVLGNMAELGTEAARLHAEVGAHARAAGIERLYTVGALAREAARAYGADAQAFDTQEAAIAALRRDFRAGVVALVKGSRSAAMERVVAALAGAAAGGHSHAA